MARQRISLVNEEVKQELNLEAKIKSGEINAENFATLTADDQAKVNKTLFKMASDKINPNQGASVLEFTLFAFMRIMTKKVNGMSLTADEKEMETSLNNIMNLHEMTNTEVAKADWLFDYMGYAELKAGEILQNRKDHIARKQQVTGQV